MGVLRRAFLLALAFALCSACAGFRPAAPAAQRVFAGETARIELREAPPTDAAIEWLPGDGTAPVHGPALVHAWQRPGTYTVVVEGEAGSDSFLVEVEPRPVLRAIPAGVRFAFALPGGWSSFARFADFAGRFSAGSELQGTLEGLVARLGSDPGAPSQLVGQGIDPAEGIGAAIFEADPGAVWLLIGILDEEKALGLGQRLFDFGSFEPIETKGGTLYVGMLPSGELRAFGVVGGYLLLRTSGGSGAIEETVEAFAESGEGLQGSELFRKARALAPGDDGIFFAQVQNESGGWLPLAVGIDLGKQAASANFGVALAPRDAAEIQSALGQTVAGTLELNRFPAGAVGFLSISLDPEAAMAQAVPNALQRALLEGLATSRTGVSLRDLLRATTGNATAAIYYDPEAFTDLVLALANAGEGTEADLMPPLVARIELRDEGAVQTVRRALAAAAQPKNDGWWQRGPVFFRPGDGVLEIATLRARHLLPKADGIVDFSAWAPDEAGAQALYVDVAAILEALRRSEARSAEAAMVRALLLEQTGFLDEIRGLFFEGRAVPGGLQGTLRIDLRERE